MLNQRRFRELQRVRLVAQRNSKDCGLCCAAMVLDHFGITASLDELEARCQLSAGGVSALAMMTLLRTYGLRSFAADIRQSTEDELPLPLVLHWNSNHFVVAVRWSKKGCVVLDPAAGRRFVAWKDFWSLYSGVALAFEEDRARSEINPPRPEPPVARLNDDPASTAHNLFRAIWFPAVVGMCITGAGLLAGRMDSSVSGIRNHSLHNLVVLGLVVTFVLGLTLAHDVFWLRRTNVAALARCAPLKRLMMFDQAFFEAQTIDRIGHAVAFARGGNPPILASVLTCVVVLTWLTIASPAIATASAVICSLLFVLERSLRQSQEGVARRAVQVGHELNQHIVSRDRAGVSARFYGIPYEVGIRWEKVLARALRRDLTAGQLEIYARRSREVLFSTFAIVAGVIAIANTTVPAVLNAHLVLSVALSVFFLRLVASLIDRNRSQRQIQDRGAAVLDEVVNASAASRPNTVSSGKRLSGEVTTFGHPPATSDSSAEENPSVTTRAGGSLVIHCSRHRAPEVANYLVGASSLISMSIRYDRVAPDALRENALAAQVVLVSRRGELYDATVLENIRAGDDQINAESILTVCEELSIAEDIRHLPQGYGTRLTQNGVELSFQTVGVLILARALVRRPRIVVIEEMFLDLPKQKLEALFSAIHCTKIVVTSNGQATDWADSIHHFEHPVVIGPRVRKGSDP